MAFARLVIVFAAASWLSLAIGVVDVRAVAAVALAACRLCANSFCVEFAAILLHELVVVINDVLAKFYFSPGRQLSSNDDEDIGPRSRGADLYVCRPVTRGYSGEVVITVEGPIVHADHFGDALWRDVFIAQDCEGWGLIEVQT